MDIKGAVVLEVPRPNCGRTYQVPVLNVLESHEILNEGCTALNEGQCEPLYLAALLSRCDLDIAR